MITLEEALRRAAGQLAAHPQLREHALADAVLLLRHTLSLSRAALLAHPERPLTREDQAAYQRVLERRLRFEPVQYILGTQEFFGLELRVTPAVLIPRPETETLVEQVLARIPNSGPGRVADVGTGSGAIAIALASSLPLVSVTALDLSPAALAVARENVATHGLGERIRLLESDLFSALPAASRFDAIVSNPPYVPDGDAASLHPQVRDFEPQGALFAGADGLAIYQRLIPEAAARLERGGLLALEIGFGQRTPVQALLSAWREVEFVADLQGIDRVALARKP